MSKQGFSTVGIKVKVGEDTLNYVTEISDLGGTPSELDTTCFNDRARTSIPGVQENKAFEVTYLFDNLAADSDFRKMRAAQATGYLNTVEVTFPDGTIFASTGYVSTYVTGAKVDELLMAKLVITLQGAWNVNNPQTT